MNKEDCNILIFKEPKIKIGELANIVDSDELAYRDTFSYYLVFELTALLKVRHYSLCFSGLTHQVMSGSLVYLTRSC